MYMDAKGLTLLNYKFDIKSEDGSLRYRAATVTESLVSYNARVYNPDDTEDMPMNSVVRATIASVSPAFFVIIP